MWEEELRFLVFGSDLLLMISNPEIRFKIRERERALNFTLMFFLVLPSDVHVTCQYTQDCLLPCSFTPSGSEEISWFKQDVLIYRNSNMNDKLLGGRMWVSAPELARGNASLLLQRCVLNDKGRYRCQVTRGEKVQKYFITLQVEGEP